jgi:hypothetical protein
LAEESKDGALKISSPEELRNWLKSLPPEQGRWVDVAIAVRASLRVVPLVATHAKRGRAFENLTFAVFFATASARVAGKYPTRIKEPSADAAANIYAAANGYVDANGHLDNIAFSAAYAAANAASAAIATSIAEVATAATSALDYATAAVVNAAAPPSYAIFSADLWSGVSRDASFIDSGGAASLLTSEPLWPGRPRWPSDAPLWATQHWRRLQNALPRKDDWQVWIDWYNRRLEGVSDPEEIELVFATVPDKERKAGPAAANKWIKERLKELQKKDSPTPLPEPAPPPPEIPRQGPGPHVEIDAETGAVVPAKPESLDAEGNNIARLNAQHPQIVRLAGELLDNLGQNEQPELFAAAKSYFDNVNRDLSQIDFERLWGEGVYLEEAEAAAARRIQDAIREPLNDAALTALNALLRIHGPFILATRAGLENLAFANAYEMRLDEAKEQRAAANEFMPIFEANPDVVAPETAANFAHFAEQPESTKHPERSAAFTIGMVQNIAIVTTAGATIGTIIAEVGSETGPVVAAVVALSLIEGLKKTKPFLEVAGLVTDGLNKLSEADARALWERLKSKIPFDRYKEFVLGNEARWRKLAGSGKQFRWLHELLDWLKRMNEPTK